MQTAADYDFLTVNALRAFVACRDTLLRCKDFYDATSAVDAGNMDADRYGALKAAVESAVPVFTNADGQNAFVFVNRVTGLWPAS